MKGITPGDWEYRPSNSRQVVSETGETICKVHRGKKAQYNGPLIAAAPELLAALEDLLNICEGDPDEPEEHKWARSAIAKAKGEQG